LTRSGKVEGEQGREGEQCKSGRGRRSRVVLGGGRRSRVVLGGRTIVVISENRFAGRMKTFMEVTQHSEGC
jgi:hypothetical protein